MIETVVFLISNSEGLLVFLLLCFLGITVWFFIKWKKETKQKEELFRKNAELETINASLEAEQLKFQLQPHTLNNILANLKVLAKKLNKGMESLSKILEYIIYKGDKNLVSVEDEIEFIRKYLALNEQFTDEIDSMKLDKTQVNKTVLHYSNPSIPHLISTYFIENAFKHGDMTQPDFLMIQVSLTENVFALEVRNRIKNKSSEPNKGIGLQNMHKRMNLLFPGKYEIKQSCNEKHYVSELIIQL